MELTNIIELYKLLASDQKGFEVVLKNLFGGEVLRLRGLTKEAISFIKNEDGENANRNHYIEEELDDLSSEVKGTADFLSNFRYVKLWSTESTTTTCEDIRIRMAEINHWALDSKENFHEALRKEEPSYASVKTQDMEVFRMQKDKVLDVLRMIDSILEVIDEGLKK